ncbi:MAG: thioredoxin family protein [Bacteroidales bacterium]
MKTLLVLIQIFIAVPLFSQNISKLDSTLWHNDYNKTLEIAKAKNRPILIVFSGSDWCKPCIKLREQILVKPEFSKWAKDNAVCVTADFPKQKKNALSPMQQKQNEVLAEKFNPNGIFPLVIILNSNEKILGFKGFEDVSPEQFTKGLTEIINKNK